MEAETAAFDSRVPEEINRRIVDVTADYHLCSLSMPAGISWPWVYRRAGFCNRLPMPEVLSAHLGQIQASPVLERLGLEPQGCFLLSAHREENIDTEEAFSPLLGAVNCLAEQYGKPVLYACHPRGQEAAGAPSRDPPPLVRVHPPLGFHDYNRLQLDALCVLSDSGTCRRRAASSAPTAFPSPPSASAPSPSGPKLWSAVPSSCPVSGKSRYSLPWRQPFPWPQKDLGALVPDYPDEKVSGKVAAILQSYATQDIRK